MVGDTRRVFPSKGPRSPISEPVSIIDSYCAAIPSYTCAKLYSPPKSESDSSQAAGINPFDPALLESTLAHTLSAYLHWAGRIRFTGPNDGGRPYQRRSGRVWVDFGSPADDPGVALSFADCNERLESLVPSLDGGKPCDSGVLERAGVYPPFPSVVMLRPTVVPGPALAVQVTRFSCGGIALGFRVAHAIADAGTLHRFVADWGDVHRGAVAAGGSLDGVALPHRPFEPEDFDSRALGDLDSPEADPAIEAEVERIPRCSKDVLASGTPGDAGPAAAADAPEQMPMWDIPPPATARTVFFSPASLARIWAAAGGRAAGVNAHDALVGHIWRVTVRARRVPPRAEVSLTTVVGLGARVDPPLPRGSVGSSVVLLASTATSDALTGSGGVAVAARAVRATIAAATPRALAALLHHEAHSPDPRRIQPFFIGPEHVSITSWVGAGSYAADFGTGAPVYAEGQTVPTDGALLIEEVAGPRGKKWTEKGVRVTLAFVDDVLERFLSDPECQGAGLGGGPPKPLDVPFVPHARL